METTKELEYLQEKLSDKTISQGCRFLDGKDIKTVSLVFTAGGWKEKVDLRKYKDNYFIEFCGRSGDCGLTYVLENMKNLGHPVTTDDILLWGKKNNLDSIFECFTDDDLIFIDGADIGIRWQPGKYLSQQTPETIHELYLFVKEREDGLDKNN